MTTTPLDGLELRWDVAGAADWQAMLAQAGKSSLEQSWAYGAVLESLGHRRVRRGVVAGTGGPLAVVQAFERPVARIGTLVQITRGPLWLADGIDPAIRAAAMRLIRETWRIGRRELLVWMAELPDTPESHALMRACGTRRMVTGYSSAWLNLDRPDETLRAGLNGAWRNRLKSAEASRLRVEITTGGGAKLDWLLGNYQNFRRKARYPGPRVDAIRAFADAAQSRKDVLLLRAFERREPVAGVLLLRHGRAATYHVGWTGDAGRRLRAHNLLLWRAALELRRSGTEWLDLGGLLAASAPGVTRFKLGMGGDVFTLTGTYI